MRLECCWYTERFLGSARVAGGGRVADEADNGGVRIISLVLRLFQNHFSYVLCILVERKMIESKNKYQIRQSVYQASHYLRISESESKRYAVHHLFL